MNDFLPQFGYQDFTAASGEAERLAADAYSAGNTEAADYWNSVSWDNWSAGTDLQIAGADAYGTQSPGTGEGYFPTAPDYAGSGYSAAASTESTDFSSWYDAMSYDSSISAVQPYAGTDMSSGMAGGSMPDYTSTVDNTLSDSTMSYYTSSE